MEISEYIKPVFVSEVERKSLAYILDLQAKAVWSEDWRFCKQKCLFYFIVFMYYYL